jgi:hypothetical protein
MVGAQPISLGTFAAAGHFPGHDGLLSIGVAFGWKADGTSDAGGASSPEDARQHPG